jgi:MOSC domain-containing protein YiiM
MEAPRSTPMPAIVSIQTGRAATYTYDRPADGRTSAWTTAFWKSPVAGPVRATAIGLAGDEQADRQNHGGIDKAVLAYSADHYPAWREALGDPDIPYGGFGENLTIAGIDESSVAIGDRWRAGDVEFEVSQPRQPCWKMGRRWQRPELPKLVRQNGKSGWYLRVLSEGELTAGMTIELVSRPQPTWTIARASRLLYGQVTNDTVSQLEDLANVPELSQAWREDLLQKIAQRLT